MNGPVLIAGLVMGAAGSLHCAGMCGPLCLLLPVHQGTAIRKLMLILSYQAGRILTYSLIGLILGLIGRRFYLAGYQQWFSIGLGILAFSFALLYYFARRTFDKPLFQGYYKRIQHLVVLALKNAGTGKGSLLLGMANGLLPCGMVYMATLVAISFTQLASTVAFMALFGAGTLPMMFATAWAGQNLKWKSKLVVQKMIPVFLMLTGCLLIIRGLNLGIPFLSPQIMAAHGSAAVCAPR